MKVKDGKEYRETKRKGEHMRGKESRKGRQRIERDKRERMVEKEKRRRRSQAGMKEKTRKMKRNKIN